MSDRIGVKQLWVPAALAGVLIGCIGFFAGGARGYEDGYVAGRNQAYRLGAEELKRCGDGVTEPRVAWAECTGAFKLLAAIDDKGAR